MITMRYATAEDEPFLYELYAQTRANEMFMLGWDHAQADAFLRMQFSMQRRFYAMQYPAAVQRIMMIEVLPIGRIMTESTDVALLLIDISLLSKYQNKGIGTSLLQGLKEQAAEAGKPMRLHVLCDNPAQRLYARLGFRITEERSPYLAMEWRHQ
ncbi:GNAT family N-acetyltransferase [Paenibacillus thermotolerans]|uniref:GNAT family N-acetyltransferase n=1 Tax=Paenibacillus thermotolerans TaxID=3027807 RepID=UPI0023684005|nr:MULTISPECIES: GNAT family N-acetyltransferase [unclassified Paenibacillus]